MITDCMRCKHRVVCKNYETYNETLKHDALTTIINALMLYDWIELNVECKHYELDVWGSVKIDNSKDTGQMSIPEKKRLLGFKK